MVSIGNRCPFGHPSHSSQFAKLESIMFQCMCKFSIRSILKGEDADFRAFMESRSCSVISVVHGESKPCVPITAVVDVNYSQYGPGKDISSVSFGGIRVSLAQAKQFAGLGAKRQELAVSGQTRRGVGG